MTKLRWWLADLFRRWVAFVEPAPEGDFSEMVSHVLAQYSAELATNMEQNNALLRRLNKRPTAAPEY